MKSNRLTLLGWALAVIIVSAVGTQIILRKIAVPRHDTFYDIYPLRATNQLRWVYSRLKGEYSAGRFNVKPESLERAFGNLTLPDLVFQQGSDRIQMAINPNSRLWSESASNVPLFGIAAYWPSNRFSRAGPPIIAITFGGNITNLASPPEWMPLDWGSIETNLDQGSR